MSNYDSLSEAIGEKNIKLAHEFAVTDLPTFENQVKFLGLDKKKDFKHADLSFVAFGSADLRGYDFTGSNLTGTSGTGATWDNTTKFDGATVTSSLFAYPKQSEEFFARNPKWMSELSRLKKATWTKSIIWVADNVTVQTADRAAYIEIAKALFEDSNDRLVQSNILYFLSVAFDNRAEHRDFLMYIINKHRGKMGVIKSAVGVLANLFNRDAATICLLQDLAERQSEDKDLRRISIRGVLNSSRYMSMLPLIRDDDVFYASDLRRLFVRRVATRLGPYTLQAITEPTNDICLDFNAEVTENKIMNIARRIVRDRKLAIARASQSALRPGSAPDATHPETLAEAVLVFEQMNQLKLNGVPFVFNKDVSDLRAMSDAIRIQKPN